MYGLKIQKWILKGLDRIISSSIPSASLDAGGLQEENVAGSRQVHMLYLIGSPFATQGNRIAC